MNTDAVASVLASIRAASAQLQSCPCRRGSELTFPAQGDLVVTGDIHGDVAAFGEIVRKADLETNPLRHLLLQELIHGCDSAGGQEGSCALTEQAALLVLRFPRRVHVLMGNHEMAELTGRILLKDGVVLNELFRRSLAARYGAATDEASAAFRHFWRCLPLAARTANRVFISHSAPSRREIDHFDPSILKKPFDELDFEREGGSAYALLWGRDFSHETAARLLEMLDADFLLTGHTPCQEGFSAPNGKHIVLDSQGPRGKYLLLPLAGRLTYESLISKIRPVWS